jgi:L-iditol 2-dehydrogenase
MDTMVLGSYAEYLLIPARIARLNVFPKPPEIPFEIASLLEPFACVAQGISLLPLRSDSSVLVIGPGAIGLLFVAGLKAGGIQDVTLAGRNESRLAIGAQLGAKTCRVSDIPVGDKTRFDVVVECTGQVEVWEKSVDYSRIGGTVMLFGGCAAGTRASFDTKHLHYDQVSLLSPFHFGTQAVRQAREWILSGDINLRDIISGTRSLSDGQQVMEDLRAGKGVKFVFQP